MTRRLATAMGIGESELIPIHHRALLHAIGRMGVPDGILRKRTLPGALLDDPLRAAQQAWGIATRKLVVTTNGAELRVEANTICIHSDTPGSVAIARAVNKRLKQGGVRVRALSR